MVAVTLAVIDVEKEQDHGRDGHGSKVIVVPFDGAALDRGLQAAANTSANAKPPGGARADRTPPTTRSP